MTVIAGSADRLLPSLEEAARLEKIIPGCRRIVLEGHGHAPLFDGRVDISEIIQSDPALEGVSFPTKPTAVDVVSQSFIITEVASFTQTPWCWRHAC